MRPFVCAYFFCLLVGTLLQAQTPSITSISPSAGVVGTSITIIGANFGASGTGTVKFGNLTAIPRKWTDTNIEVDVPSGATTGNVIVTTANASASQLFTVTTYDVKHFELLTGVGSVLAGVEATSYKIDTQNNALSQTNVGKKKVEILLGGGFILPFHASGHWIEKSWCGTKDEKEEAAKNGKLCRDGGDVEYRDYRPWETFLSIRFAPSSDQTINGFVVGVGYRITKYFTLLTGYSLSPVDEPTHGFRAATSQIVAANPTISPYNHFNAADLLNNKPGAFDGFPLFLYNANGVTTTKIFPTSPVVTHHRSGIFFGVGIPLNLTALFKPSTGK
jgi:hypothetical protein